MRIFRDCQEAASELKREVSEMGTEVHLQTMQDKDIEGNPDYFTKELLGYSYMIVDPRDKDEMLNAFDKLEGKTWAEKEFAERISQKNLNPGEAWKERQDVWEEFMHDGKFSYTYSERIGDQVQKVIDELKKHPSSRQGIISVWDRQIDIDRLGKERVPCSMFYQVINRGGKLHMIYTTRSNDVYEHWPYDVWLAIKLQEYISEKTNIKPGRFYQFITSFHTYAYKQKGTF
jgi:thymidylate synthase